MPLRSVARSTGGAFGRICIIVVLALGVIPGAGAQVPVAEADFSGHATAATFHADALQSGNTRVVDSEVAFSSAAVGSTGLTRTVNEMERVVTPADPAKRSYARGSGIEAGLVVQPSGENQVILAGKAEASAPPATGPLTKEIGPVPADPAAWASLARGVADARFAGGECVLGRDLASGLGYVADVELLDAGGNSSADRSLDQPLVALDADDPDRSVSQSRSSLRLVRQVTQSGVVQGDAFGLTSEVRQTIAPVTLFEGGANEITIELLGEWVFRVVATGRPGGAFVHYGPGTVSPQTPILRTIDASGNVRDIVTTQQIFQNPGLVIPIPGGEIAVGEDPRAIRGNATTTPLVDAGGREAAGAVDVVRVKLFEQTGPSGDVTQRAADFRVGHMEARVRVPAGGIACRLPVTKTATPSSVTVGNAFDVTMTVTNPYACELRSVRITDDISVEGGARFAVESSVPPATTAPGGTNRTAGTVVWNDIGTIGPGQSKSVMVTVRAQGSAGRIVDVATATGSLAGCAGEATGQATAGVTGAVVSGVSAPLRVPTTAVLGVQLPRTGPPPEAIIAGGIALVALGLAMRRTTSR